MRLSQVSAFNSLHFCNLSGRGYYSHFCNLSGRSYYSHFCNLLLFPFLQPIREGLLFPFYRAGNGGSQKWVRWVAWVHTARKWPQLCLLGQSSSLRGNVERFPLPQGKVSGCWRGWQPLTPCPPPPHRTWTSGRSKHGCGWNDSRPNHPIFWNQRIWLLGKIWKAALKMVHRCRLQSYFKVRGWPKPR